MNKKKLILIITSIILFIVLGILAFVIITNNHNKKVDEYASELGNQMCEASVDFSNTTLEEEKIYENYVVLSTMKENNKVDEGKLTYFDGSKSVYNSLNEKLDYLILQYNLYIKKRFDDSFNSLNIDVNSSSKEQLSSTLEQLNSLNSKLDNAWNKTLWNNEDGSKSTWSLVWGSSESESKENFNKYKGNINNKINEINNKLQSLNQSSNSNTSKTSNNNSNSGYSGSSSGSGGSGGGGGQHTPTIEEAEAAWQAYLRTCEKAGIPPQMDHDTFIRKYLYGG